jgi:hypothetical protein
MSPGGVADDTTTMGRHNLILFLPESTALRCVPQDFLALNLFNPTITFGIHAEEVTDDVAWNQAYKNY